MRLALLMAQKAYDAGEVPVGAILVNHERCIVGVGCNRVERCYSQTAHAEVCALVAATTFLKDWRIVNGTMYVTLQPCGMCMHLMILSRITTVVYGAPSPVFGYHLDNDLFIQLYKNNIVMNVRNGSCSNEASLMLRSFFKKVRSKK